MDGVYTADPNICPNARKIARITYEEMLELASLGAKVLQIRSVEFGMKYGVPIHVRSSFNDNPGTWVVPEEEQMETVLVAGRDRAHATRPRSRCSACPTGPASRRGSSGRCREAASSST